MRAKLGGERRERAWRAFVLHCFSASTTSEINRISSFPRRMRLAPPSFYAPSAAPLSAFSPGRRREASHRDARFVKAKSGAEKACETPKDLVFIPFPSLVSTRSLALLPPAVSSSTLSLLFYLLFSSPRPPPPLKQQQPRRPALGLPRRRPAHRRPLEAPCGSNEQQEQQESRSSPRSSAKQRREPEDGLWCVAFSFFFRPSEGRERSDSNTVRVSRSFVSCFSSLLSPSRACVTSIELPIDQRKHDLKPHLPPAIATCGKLG